MEIDKYNSICEYRNKYNKISAEQNSAFAKIFIGSDEHFNGNNINSIQYTTVCKNKLLIEYQTLILNLDFIMEY